MGLHHAGGWYHTKWWWLQGDQLLKHHDLRGKPTSLMPRWLSGSFSSRISWMGLILQAVLLGCSGPALLMSIELTKNGLSSEPPSLGRPRKFILFGCGWESPQQTLTPAASQITEDSCCSGRGRGVLFLKSLVTCECSSCSGLRCSCGWMLGLLLHSMELDRLRSPTQEYLGSERGVGRASDCTACICRTTAWV